MFKRVLAILLLTSSAPALAESTLYSWTDAAGVVHYSSKASDKRARLAQLPPIMRGEVKLSKNTDLKSCNDHGGVDCSAGADEDGSVVCYDGFSEASLRFMLSCGAAKLEIQELGAARPDSSFPVVVRNSKNVEARGVSLTFKRRGEPAVLLTGPSTIAGLEMGEFSLLLPPHTDPKIGEISLTCENCNS